MKRFIESTDRTQITYEVSGSGETALLFIHGWLGNKGWWLEQAREFEKQFLIVRMDLAGHGESGKNRGDYSSKQYADDIATVANSIPAKNMILVGHSMSGAYILEAARLVKNLRALIVVDTVKDIGETIDAKMMAQLFEGYGKDFPGTVKNVLPKFLYSVKTPEEVKKRLEDEFLKHDGNQAVKLLLPLYRMDLPALARLVKVPVRAINSDHVPTNVEGNRKFLRDYDARIMRGTGHYPMLEAPEAFNNELKLTIHALKDLI